MKQKVSAPLAIAVSVVVLGLIGFFLYGRYFSGPPVVIKPTGPSATMQRPENLGAMSVDQKKQMYGMRRPGGQ